MMTCAEVLEALRKGNAVRRESEEYYYVLDNDGFIHMGSIESGKRVVFNVDFIFYHAEVVNDKTDFIAFNENILNKDEREYLAGILAPLKKSVERVTISKCSKNSCYGNGYEYLKFTFWDSSDDVQDEWDFPLFKAGSMYKGMRLNEEYTLEELGL